MSDKEIPVTSSRGPALVITVDDLDPDTRNQIYASKRGKRVLLGTEDATQALFNSLPGAIARRIRRIMPDEFAVAEIELRLALSSQIPGLELGGDVVVKLQPKTKT